MQRAWLHLKNTPAPGGSRTARLLDDHADRIGFVHQTQTARLARVFGVFGVHENTAAHENAVHVGHHRGDPAGVEVAPARTGLAGLALRDIALNRRLPEALVAGVDGEFAGVCGNLQIGMGEDEVADFTVKRKAVRAFAHGQHQHGGRAVDSVTRSDLLHAGAQVVGHGGVADLGVAQHRKNGADRDVDVGVTRPVERIENEHVGAALEFLRQGVRVVHFFGRHASDQAAPLARLDHGVVGEHVELFLHFALHVLRVERTEEAAERPLGGHGGDGLDRGGHIHEQGSEIGLIIGAVQLLDEEF